MPRSRLLGPPALALLFAAAGPAADGPLNPVLRVGDAAPNWEGLDGIDGKKHALADLKDKDVVVVVFTCTDCVVARDYERRLVAFAEKYAGPNDKVAVVAVSLLNHGERDSLDGMRKRAADQGYNFHFILDPTQQLGKDYGAAVTPDVFVLNKARKVAYLGAFDDQRGGSRVQAKYVESAVEALLEKQDPPVFQTRPYGCPIRYAKK